MSGVLVLNAGYEPLHRVSLAHAVRMLHRQVAVVEQAVDGRTFGPYPLPAVLRLVRYVQMRWRSRGGVPTWTKAGMLRRDGGRCAYCGRHGDTVDHVQPRSRGGADSWLNTVTACGRCNHRKRDRIPEEAGMALRYLPRVPTFAELLTAGR